MTWECHVCGDSRPDDRISVYHLDSDDRRLTVRVNVRYCNDRPACVEGADEKAREMLGPWLADRRTVRR